MNECLHIQGFQNVLKLVSAVGRVGSCDKLRASIPLILGSLGLPENFEIYNVEVRKCH